MVVAYAPTEVSKILTKVEFYKELNATLKHLSGIIQGRLDYIFISRNLQEC